MILAIGFRVRSPRGVQFRRWANTQLRTYLDKGFLLDKERLKNPQGRFDHFDELLEQIREIRASELRFYQKYESYLNYPVTTIKQIKSLKCFCRNTK